MKNKVEDLEEVGIKVIQIDEAALRDGLPLWKSEQAFYLEWAVHSFRITNFSVEDATQVSVFFHKEKYSCKINILKAKTCAHLDAQCIHLN